MKLDSHLEMLAVALLWHMRISISEVMEVRSGYLIDQ